jgi:hypothetical protein
MTRKLSKEERLEMIREEMRLGQPVWNGIELNATGKKISIKTCKKWGAISINNKIILLDNYPGHEEIGPAGRADQALQL